MARRTSKRPSAKEIVASDAMASNSVRIAMYARNNGFLQELGVSFKQVQVINMTNWRMVETTLDDVADSILVGVPWSAR